MLTPAPVDISTGFFMQTITRISPVREFTARLQAGERLEQAQILEIMNDYCGSSANGQWSWKVATDAIEAAMVSYLLAQPTLTLSQLRELQNLTVDHSVRSQEQLDLQQFSTPLELAWLVAKAAMVQTADVLLEPSAGTGILIGSSINQSAKPERIILNEFSKSRRDLLTEILPQSERFSVNAEYLNDMLLQRIQPSVIVMNPPFSRGLTSTKRNPDVCLRHLRSALLRLLPNGRLVAIVAHWLSPKKYADYFATLPAKLRLSVYLDGSFYRHHGTTMPTRLLVFDQADNREESYRSIDHPMTIEEIGQIIDLVVPPRLSMVTTETIVDDSLLALPLCSNTQTNPFGNLPLFQLIAGDATTTTADLQITIKPVKPTSQPLIPIKPKSQFGEIVELSYRPIIDRTTTFSDGIYQSYSPSAIEIIDAAAHPTPLVESAAMAAITAPYPTCTVKLPARIIEEGLASREQLEALIYACDAHSRLLDTKWTIADNGSMSFATEDDLDGKYHRTGFMIADGTGCGKGVEAALIILANWCEGRKKAVWVTKNQPLLPDARRDWLRLGGDAEQVVPLSNFKLGEKITLTEGILFVTYGGLKTGANGEKKSRVTQIVEWLGADFDGVMCFDESHLMGNCAGETGERGQSKASAQALAGTELINRLPHARVVYLSATGAAKVANLAYCWRLGLWMTKAFPFTSREQFLAKMGDAGITILESLTQDLKRLGLLISRTLSFDGVSFETIVHQLTPDQRQIWDLYAQAFEVIHQDIFKAMGASNLSDSDGKCLNSRAKCTIMSRFESLKQQFFNGLLCAAKAPTLIAAIEADLQAGKSCIIQLVSTNEAILDRKLAEIPTDQWGNLRSIDFTAREVIADYAVNAFPVHLYIEYCNEDDKKCSKLAVDEHGDPILCREAVEIRDNLIESIALLPPLTGLLDQILWHFSTEQVAEVTGRTKRIICQDDRYQLSTRSSSASVAETEAFQNGQKRILVFSAAGSTGKSYHADRDCLNQTPRRHYAVECGWNVVNVMQSFGRSNRSNQVHPPEIVLISTDVKGEMRFTATVSSRLSALGAISKGDRATGNNGLFDEDTNDITSEYAKVALGEFFADLGRNLIPEMSLAEFERRTGLKLSGENGALATGDLPKINTFLNRLLALPIYEQNLVFAEFETRIQRRIAQAKSLGIYDRGVETLWSKYGFEIIDSQVLHTQNNAETICHTIDKLTKPYLIDSRSAQIILAQGYDCYRHRKNGSLAIAIVADARTKRDGSIVATLNVSYPVAGKESERIDVTDFTSWDKIIAERDYWHKWDETVAQVPDFVRNRSHLISGLLLPIWDKLPSQSPKVVRLQANDGRVLIGRSIEAQDLPQTLGKFGMNIDKLMDAATIFHLVWDGDGNYTVGGKWCLRKSYFKGGFRLEITEVYDRSDLGWLRSIGCFSEMLQCKMRVFMPIDLAEKIIEILMK
jgi:P-loop containing NTP hydrolase pore-1/C-terminal domain on Strawberry notch homologue